MQKAAHPSPQRPMAPAAPEDLGVRHAVHFESYDERTKVGLSDLLYVDVRDPKTSPEEPRPPFAQFRIVGVRRAVVERMRGELSCLEQRRCPDHRALSGCETREFVLA